MIIIQCILMQQPCKSLSVYPSISVTDFYFGSHVDANSEKQERTQPSCSGSVDQFRVNSIEIDLLYCLTMSKDL